MEHDGNVKLREKLQAIYRVTAYRPVTTVGLAVFSIATAILEGVGLTFIVPIVNTIQTDGTPDTAADGILGIFVDAYALLGIPFILEYVIIGVTVVIAFRYLASFLVSWFQVSLRTQYLAYLQKTAYVTALDAQIAYFDREGSDEILNALVTQSEYASGVISTMVSLLQRILMIIIYFVIALYLAPLLTFVTVVILGALAALLRFGISSGYGLGERVADANEQIQEYAQAGTQGIRDVKLFGLTGEFRRQFLDTVDEYATASIEGYRNQSALDNAYRFGAAAAVFALVYFAVTYAALSFAALGVFLFTIFRLAPQISSLNSQLYRIERDLPHLVRTQRFIDELSEYREPKADRRDIPSSIDTVEFETIDFNYDGTDDAAIEKVSFTVDQGEFTAFVGPSGAGKSTIAALMARLYEPNNGSITANGVPIDKCDLRTWRSKIAVVRQQPYIFDATLRWNVTVGNRAASRTEIEQACEAAQVTEFLSELPNGYDTRLGDDGVRLSGGQRQRVAIARALLKDADVLLLDEATSELDTVLEHRIYDAIASENGDRILIVIAHRLSTVTDADRIYVMEDGQIVGCGTHEELIESNRTYADLYAMQIAETVSR